MSIRLQNGQILMIDDCCHGVHWKVALPDYLICDEITALNNHGGIPEADHNLACPCAPERPTCLLSPCSDVRSIHRSPDRHAPPRQDGNRLLVNSHQFSGLNFCTNPG